jgi:hypothetical protein
MIVVVWTQEGDLNPFIMWTFLFLNKNRKKREINAF